MTRLDFYRGGLIKSLLVFLGLSLVSLIALNRLDAFVRMPEDLLQIAQPLDAALSGIPEGWVYSVIAAWVAVLCLASLLGARQMKRLAQNGNVLGLLLPRDGEERWLCVAISLNAGLSEELFFRVVLPLLLVVVAGPGVAFVAAVLLFGLGHAYQGLWGVVATSVVGAILFVIYLYTGNLWLVVGIHAGIDLWSLVVVPLLVRWNAAGG
jgi:membrane protease YdiL (CAAX protease family)